MFRFYVDNQRCLYRIRQLQWSDKQHSKLSSILSILEFTHLDLLSNVVFVCLHYKGENHTCSDFTLIIRDAYIEYVNFSGQISNTQSLVPSFPFWSSHIWICSKTHLK